MTVDILERLSIAVFLQGWQLHILDILVFCSCNLPDTASEYGSRNLYQEVNCKSILTWEKELIFLLPLLNEIDM